MKRSRTQSSSSNTDADRPSRGQILFQLTEFKAFVKRRDRTPEGNIRRGTESSDLVHINGLPWQIDVDVCECEGTAANPNCIHIDISLCCSGDETDMAWACRAAHQFSVFKKSGECLMKRGELDNFELYTARDGNGHDCAYTVEVD
ncbi:hypothetical protein GPALN_006902 [Globodera pallida]|nr:hypothetical protein GPALN_006902 [Globodera pallida]